MFWRCWPALLLCQSLSHPSSKKKQKVCSHTDAALISVTLRYGMQCSGVCCWCDARKQHFTLTDYLLFLGISYPNSDFLISLTFRLPVARHKQELARTLLCLGFFSWNTASSCVCGGTGPISCHWETKMYKPRMEDPQKADLHPQKHLSDLRLLLYTLLHETNTSLYAWAIAYWLLLAKLSVSSQYTS